MTLRVLKSGDKGVIVFNLSGRIEAEHVAELKKLFEAEGQDHRIVLDLKEVKLVDRDAVRYLAHCEMNGTQLEDCPGYIREWIVRERDRK